MTRMLSAVLAAVLAFAIIGCVLMLPLPQSARVTEPDPQSLAARPEVLAEFEKVLYKYDDFHDEPGAESVSFTKWDLQLSPLFITKDEARQDVGFLCLLLRLIQAGPAGAVCP